MRLPPEIRNKIFEYAFSTARVSASSESSTSICIVEDGSVLLQLCRQIRAEAASLKGSYTSLKFFSVVSHVDLLYYGGDSGKMGAQLSELWSLDFNIDMAYHLCDQTVGQTWFDGWDRLDHIPEEYKSVEIVRASSCHPPHPKYSEMAIVEAMRTIFGKPGLLVQIHFSNCVCMRPR